MVSIASVKRPNNGKYWFKIGNIPMMITIPDMQSKRFILLNKSDCVVGDIAVKVIQMSPYGRIIIVEAV